MITNHDTHDSNSNGTLKIENSHLLNISYDVSHFHGQSAVNSNIAKGSMHEDEPIGVKILSNGMG